MFDVEVLLSHDPHAPIMAVATSATCWYAWVSPDITNHTSSSSIKNRSSNGSPHPSSRTLIPLMKQSNNTNHHPAPRIVIGHNVGFDRSKVSTEYSYHAKNTGWIDTMSLHLSISGLTNQQRPLWLSYKKARDEHAKSSFIDDNHHLGIGGGGCRSSTFKETAARLKEKQFAWCSVVSTNGEEYSSTSNIESSQSLF